MVFTFVGQPRERSMRIRQSTTPGSYHIRVDDLSYGTQRGYQPCSAAKQPPLRSQTVPGIASAKHHSDSIQTLPNDSDFMVNWAVRSSPITTTPECCSPSDSSEAAFSATADDLHHLQPSPAAPARSQNQRSGSDGLVDLQLARSAEKALNFPVSCKRGRQEPDSERLSKRHHSPSSESSRVGEVVTPSDAEVSSEGDSGDDASEGDASEDEDDGDCDDEDETSVFDPAAAMKASDFSAAKPSQLPFPCPYSLRNPRGTLCDHPHMKSPRYVENHLFFFHRRPPFCPVCGVTFTTYAACDTHIVSRACQKTEPLPFVEGLTEVQTKELTQCLDSRLSKAEQYRAIWEVVHPGIEPPS